MAKSTVAKFNRYTNMEFEDYEFQEYPMLVYPEGKIDPKTKRPLGVLVNNDDERAAVMDTGAAPVRAEDEKARLLKVAGIKGVLVDKRWSAAKITKALEDAGFDPDIDPDA